MSGEKQPIIRLRGIVKKFYIGQPNELEILHGIDLDVNEGEFVAIVGESGSGKSTLLKLLMRFYDVQSGSIKIGGHDIRDFARDDLRSMFGMVLQDTHLFTGTIADNIRFGKLDATQEEIEAAAKIANADSFIRRLPKGYDTMVTSDGANLSQGQRQLLAIARAAVADPPVMVLDEATSSIDTKTERLIQEATELLLKGRTSFLIAHRLSTIRRADLILVVRDGAIVEQGTHDELIRKKGYYRDLYRRQFEQEQMQRM